MTFNKIKVILLLSVAVLAIGSSTSFKMHNSSGEVKWLDFNNAVELNSKHPKKIFIDVYTGWCGWCKRMDATTYTDPEVIKYLNKNYYAVRLDAETNETFYFNGHEFRKSNPGEKGSTNELASSLLDGKLLYPTTIYFDEKFQRLSVAPGYVSAQDLLVILHYFGDNKYLDMNFDDYKKSLEAQQVPKSN